MLAGAERCSECGTCKNPVCLPVPVKSISAAIKVPVIGFCLTATIACAVVGDTSGGGIADGARCIIWPGEPYTQEGQFPSVLLISAIAQLSFWTSVLTLVVKFGKFGHQQNFDQAQQWKHCSHGVVVP